MIKGTLHKNRVEGWLVLYTVEETWDNCLPIHPYYEKYYFLDEDADGAEVEFEIEDFWETGLEEVIKVAKLVRPKSWYLDKGEPMGKGVDLDKLEKKLDGILETETAESFHNWLESKRVGNDGFQFDAGSTYPPEDSVEKLESEYWKELEDRREVAKNFKGQVAGRHPDMFGHSEMMHMLRGYLEGYNKANENLYSEADIDRLLGLYTDDAPASYIKRDYKKYLKQIKNRK